MTRGPGRGQGRRTRVRRLAPIRTTWPRVASLGLASLALVLLGNALYIPAKAALAQHLLHRAWASAEAGGTAKPWPWADTRVSGKLSVGDRDFIVLEGAAGEAMAFAPALSPGLGQPVISAHRDTHFRVLGDVGPGDRVEWTTLRGTTHYRVVAREIVPTPQALVMEGALILTTCWPLDAIRPGPQRLVVTALPVAETAPAPS